MQVSTDTGHYRIVAKCFIKLQKKKRVFSLLYNCELRLYLLTQSHSYRKVQKFHFTASVLFNPLINRPSAFNIRRQINKIRSQRVNEIRSFVIDQALKLTDINVRMVIFRRNATHCISPYAIVICVCVCVCLSVCMSVCVCVCSLVDLRKTV